MNAEHISSKHTNYPKFVHFLLHRLNPDDNYVVFCNGNVLHQQQCERGFGEWLDDIRAFSKILTSLEVDISSFACLTALVLVTGKGIILSVVRIN